MNKIKNKYIKVIISLLVILTFPLWFGPFCILFLGGMIFENVHWRLWGDEEITK
jgi:hypothetical protein